MKIEELLAVFAARFTTPAELAAKLDKLLALLDAQEAGAEMKLADVQAAQANAQAESIRQAAQARVNAASAKFAELVKGG